MSTSLWRHKIFCLKFQKLSQIHVNTEKLRNPCKSEFSGTLAKTKLAPDFAHHLLPPEHCRLWHWRRLQRRHNEIWKVAPKQKEADRCALVQTTLRAKLNDIGWGIDQEIVLFEVGPNAENCNWLRRCFEAGFGFVSRSNTLKYFQLLFKNAFTNNHA
jgi:collagenase-like PrtC family protease